MSFGSGPGWRTHVVDTAGGKTYGTTLAENVLNNERAAMSSMFHDNGAADYNAYDGFPVGNQSLGQITQYRPTVVATMIEKWTLFDNINVFTKILPVIKTDQLKMGFQKITFLPTIAQPTAERARPRTVESKRTSITDVLERLAIGLEFNYAMLTTPEGRELYWMGLAQLRDAVDTSNALQCLNELQTCMTPWRVFEKRYAKFVGRTLKEVMDDEAFYFGIFQRLDGAFQLLDTKITALQAEYRGRGNTYIMSQKCVQYTTQVPDRNTQYWLGGPDAIASFNKGPVGVTGDGRGNVIVSLQAYVVNDQRPLDMLKSYVTYMEFNDFRDLKRGGDYSNHYDKERWIAIFNVDTDSWSLITTEYIIENCCRFHRETGEPLSIYSNHVARHSTHYDAVDMKDPYHYLSKRQDTGSPLLLPVRYMGQIDLSHVTTNDIFAHAGVSVEKMHDLHKAFSQGRAQTVIADGLEMLRYIESLPYDAAANMFVTAVRDHNLGLYNHRGRQGVSAFVPSFSARSFGQNEHSGWDLPPRSESATYPKLPFGYGSAAGFLTIAAAFDKSGQNGAQFQQAYGFSGEHAQKVYEFVRLLREYVAYLQSFYPLCPALIPEAAAPWWQRPTALHTLWDTVLVQHHRLPYHVALSDESMAGLTGDGSRAPQRSAVINLSQSAADYLFDHLVGRMELRGSLPGLHLPSAGAKSTTRIGADLTSGESPDGPVWTPYQRYATEAANRQELRSRLPAFARVRYPPTVWGDEGPLLRPFRYGQDRANDDLQSVREAFDVLVALIFNTLQPEPQTVNREYVERQAARAVVLSVMSFVRLEDLENKDDAASARILASRLKEVFDKIRGNLSYDVIASGTAAEILSSLRPATVIQAFYAAATEGFKQGDANPFKFKTQDGLDKARAYLRRILEQAEQEVEEVSRTGSRGRTTANYSPENYIPSPLVYSPTQLTSHLEFVETAAPIALPASTLSPGQAMDRASESAHVRAIDEVLANPTNSAALRQLDPALIPSGIGIGSPVEQNAVAVHIQRARQHSQDISMAEQRATQMRVGAPASKSTEEELAAADLLAPGFEASRQGSVQVPRGGPGFPQISSKTFPSRKRAAEQAAPHEDRGAAQMVGKKLRSMGTIDPSLPEMLLTPNFVASWNAVDESVAHGHLASWTAKVFLLSPFHSKVLKNWAQKNLVVPIRALLFRAMVLGTYSLIKCWAGPETGNSWFGQPMFTWSNDGVNQVYYAQFVYYFKAKVVTLENVFHAPNVFLDEYLGGFGDRPVGWANQSPVYLAHEDNLPAKPSVYVTLEPYNNPRGRYSSVISITGQAKDAFGKHKLDLKETPGLDFESAPFFNSLYGHQAAIVSGEVSEHVASNSNFEPGHNPVVAFQGCTKHWSPKNQDYTATVASAGYLPTEWYGKGLKDLLSGKLVKAPNYQHELLVQ